MAEQTPPSQMSSSSEWRLTSLRRGPFDPQNLVKIRWLALVGQLLACLIIHFGFGFPFPFLAALGVIVTSAFVNMAIDQRNRHVKTVRPVEIMMALSFDILQLAALIYLTGGLLNPFFILSAGANCCLCSDFRITSNHFFTIACDCLSFAFIRVSLAITLAG